MIVHLLTEQQKNLLIGKRYFSNSYFNPIQDINDNWIISQEEVLNATYEDVLWVKDLATIEYIAKPPIINSN
jgi:hypothetical protein